MYATYKIKPEEFTYEFFMTLKNTFKDKEVTLYVEENNDTEYLLKSPINSEKIFKSIKEFQNGDTKSFSYEEFKKIL